MLPFNSIKFVLHLISKLERRVIMRYQKTKRVLIFWCLFISICAIFGSTCMFIDPTGNLLQMNNVLPYFEVLPFSEILFQNYIFSGIALLIINGLSNLLAAYLLIKNKKSGIILGTIFGFTLMLWITIQFIILPINALSITYFIFGLLQLIAGYMTYVFYTQENFEFNISEYQNISKNRGSIVIYFSRLGYTKKVAYEKANELGADIIELKTKEKTDGTTGFWWCGRFGMHGWPMSTEDIKINLKKYKKVIIVTPIWVFSISAPIRDFCYKYGKDINEVEYIFTHFMCSNFTKEADRVDKILNKKRSKFTSVCIRLGKIIRKSELD